MEKSKPIIALDFKSKNDTQDFLGLFPNESLNIKIGMELFYSAGPEYVREVVQRGHDIFLDLKLYDIPNTVQSAMEQLAQLGVSMINVHASGGVAMMEAAFKGLSDGVEAGQKRPQLIGVTQLTSRDAKTNQEELQLAVTQEESILNLAKLTEKSGLDGVVCSPLEAGVIKKTIGKDFLTVTPGIRSAKIELTKDDQVRITTPANAAEWGSDYIVVGRPITRAQDPARAYAIISDEWQQALKGGKR